MKKAIIVVSFGTSVAKGREENITPIVKKISNRFSEYDVFEAFSSRIIVKKLRDRGETIDTEVDCLTKLLQTGYEEVFVQPLHLIGGEEFEKLKHNLETLAVGKIVLRIGRPLLYFMGQEERPDDYGVLLTALESIVPDEARQNKEIGTVMVGHGGNNPVNSSYSVLQLKALQSGWNQLRVVSLESYPTLEDTVIPYWGNPIPQKIHLYPLLLVAGDHAINDIFGKDEDAVLPQLIHAGFTVETHTIGLGSLPQIQDIYVQHLADAIDGLYEGRPKHRPAIPKNI